MRHASSHALWVMLGIATPAVATPVDTNLQLWLDGADASTLADGEGDNPGDGGFDGTIQTWNDKSGTGRDATAVNAGNRPTYVGATLNNQSVVGFGDAANVNTGKAFDLAGTDIVLPETETMFFVVKMFDNGNNRGMWVGRNGTLDGFGNDDNRYFVFAQGNGTAIANNAPSAFQLVTETRENANEVFQVWEDGGSVGTNTRSNPMTIDSVGRFFSPRYFWGQMGEILIYDRTLNTAERVITDNYLSAKWGTALAANDRYAGDTAGNAHHDFDVFGIAEDTAGTVSPAGQLASSSGGALALSELSASLDTGDYALAGHSGEAHGTTGADLPATADSRWTRDYYLDITGTLDARLTFDFGDAGLGLPTDPDGYTLLYRATPAGTFTDTGLTGAVLGDSVSFDLLALDTTDDGFYTIGTAVIPEPASLAMLGLSAAMLLGRR